MYDFDDQPDDFARFLAGLFPQVPEDVVPRAAVDPDVLAKVREAAEDFRMTLHEPGDVVEDVNGFPSSLSEPTVIHPGEVEAVPGEWTTDDWPPDWEVYGDDC